MKKTNKSTEKVMSFLTKNVGFVGLLTIINFLLIYFLVDRLQTAEVKIRQLEMMTNQVSNEVSEMSQPIFVEEDMIEEE